MKKFMVFMVLMVGSALFLLQGSAQAKTFTFNDNTIYWAYTTNNSYMPGWNSGNSWASSDSSDNTRENIGSPDFPNITAGRGEIDNTGYLTSVSFFYGKGNTLKSGDVFIDVGADNNWDYIISSGETMGKGGLAQGVYSVNSGSTFSAYKGSNNGYYILSNAFYSSGHRNDHPVAVDASATANILSSVDDDISFVSFDNDTSTPVKFSNLDGIDLDNKPFIIAFAPVCANDVIYERVPEPGVALLLGIGLLALGLTSGRRMFVGKEG